MAAKYRKVDPRIWTDEAFEQLDPGQKLVALNVITASQSNRVGIFKLSVGQAAEHCGMKLDSYRIAIERVCAALHWGYDKARSVVYLPTWFKYNPPENPKHFTGCLDDLHDVPQTHLLTEFLANDKYLPAHSVPLLAKLADSYAIPTPIPPPIPPAYQEREREQERELNRERENECSEQPGTAASEPAPVAAALMEFPVNGNAPGPWPLTQAAADELAAAFPAVDVLAECRKARLWATNNPRKRKTTAGMPRFLAWWMGQVQDRNGGRLTAAPTARRAEIDHVHQKIDAFFDGESHDPRRVQGAGQVHQRALPRGDGGAAPLGGGAGPAPAVPRVRGGGEAAPGATRLF